MEDLVVVIEYQFENEPMKSIVLNTIEDVSVSSPTQITTQPMVNGDEISDHQFRLPKSVTVSGSYSLNGSNKIVIGGSGTKLANFQDLFERIQKEAVLCNVYKIYNNDKNNLVFSERKNLALQNITWTERINTLDFVFNFKEAMLVDVTKYEDYMDAANLPNVTEPQTTSFTNEIVKFDLIDAMVVEILKKEGLISTEFQTYCESLDQNSVKTSLISAGVGISLVAAGAFVPGVNVVLAFGGALVAAGYGLYSLFNGINKAVSKAKERKKYAVETFKLYENSDQNEQELERFADFLYGIHQEVEKINDLFHVYTISVDGPQEAMINIGDDYFIFTFTKNNVEDEYSLSISNLDSKNKITKEVPNIKTDALNDISQFTSSNYLFKASNNARVYLSHPDTEALENKMKKITEEELCYYSQEEIKKYKEDYNKLISYSIIVCDFNPEDFMSMITKIIENKIYVNAGG